MDDQIEYKDETKRECFSANTAEQQAEIGAKSDGSKYLSSRNDALFFDDMSISLDNGYGSDFDYSSSIPEVHGYNHVDILNGAPVDIQGEIQQETETNNSEQDSVTSLSDRGSSISTLEQDYEDYVERLSLDFNLSMGFSPDEEDFLGKMKQCVLYSDGKPVGQQLMYLNNNEQIKNNNVKNENVKSYEKDGGVDSGILFETKNGEFNESIPLINKTNEKEDIFSNFEKVNDKNTEEIIKNENHSDSAKNHDSSHSNKEEHQEIACNGITENGFNWYQSPFYVSTPTKDVTNQEEPSAKLLKDKELQEIKLLLQQPSLNKINNENISDEDDLPPRQRRRCKSLKSIKTPPPENISNKKMVRFADAMGLDLVHVKHVINHDDPPHIPASAVADLELGMVEIEQPRPSGMGTTYLHMCFSQPGSKTNFIQCVQDRNVMLENCMVDGQERMMSGVIRVQNIAFHKHVIVRYTIDNWRTFKDIDASYLPDSNDGVTDRFTFSVRVPSYFQIGDRLQVAVKYSVNGKEYWDNNSGRNYVVQCLPVVEKDNSCMSFCMNLW